MPKMPNIKPKQKTLKKASSYKLARAPKRARRAHSMNTRPTSSQL